MPGEVDSLILEASVIDNFSRQLDQLSRELGEIEAQESAVDPIDIDAEIGDALVELEILEKQIDRIDNKDVDIDVGIDQKQMDLLRAQATTARVRNRGERALAAREGVGIMPGRDTDAMQRLLRQRTRDNDALDIDLPRPPDVDVGFPRLMSRRGEDGPSWQGILKDFSTLRVSMGMFMNLMASFIPLFAVFVGALPAAIAGLGALAVGALAAAGALAGVVGLGVGAMMFEGGELNVSELQDKVREALDTALESFAPVMNSLQPVAEDMFRSMNFIMRDLAAHMRSLLNLTDEAGAFFDWLGGVLGPAIEETILFGEAVAPVMGLIAGGIGDIDWFGIMAGVIADTLPLLVTFTGLIMNMLPAIYQMSLGFFRVANAITAFFSILWALLDLFGPLPMILGSLIALILTAVSATALWSLATGNLMTRVYEVTSFITGKMVSVIATYTTSMFGAAAGTWAAYAATAALIGLLTFGLAPVISSVVGTITGMNNSLGNTTDQLRSFQQQQNRIGGNFHGAGGGGQGGPGYSTAQTNITIEAPDRETGNAAAHTAAFSQQTATTNQSDVDNRQHGGG